MNWYLGVLKNYVGFSGRARRKEYWMFVWFNLLVSIVLYLADRMLGTLDAETGVGILGGLYSLAVLLPTIAVAVRRLHDTGRSGWWLLIGFLPLIGAIVLLVFFVLDSEPGSNAHGPNPKQVAA